MVFPILHSYLCGEDNYSLVEANSTYITNVPHITECTQHLELSWIPFLFLAVFSPVILHDLHKSDNARTRSCSPVTLRIGICIVLVIDLTFSFLHNAYQYYSQGHRDALTYLVGDLPQYIGLSVALVLLIASRNRGLVTSGVLFIYWFLCVFCGFPELRYLISQYSHQPESVDTLRYSLYLIYYPLVVLQLILSCFADSPSATYGGKNECPEMSASFLNQITFNWFTGMAWKGNKRPLEKEDLWDLNERDKSKVLTPQFMKYFGTSSNEYQEKRRQFGREKELKESEFPSIMLPLIRTYKWTLLSGGLFKFLFDILQFVAPQLLHQLITFIQDRSQPMWVGVAIASLMFIVAMVQSMILHQYFHNMFRLGMNIRAVLTAAVYRKSLSLSTNARKNRTVGEIVNLMTVDIQRFQDMTTFAMLFWSAPLQVSLSIYFLYQLLGLSVVAGVLILIGMVPFNTFIASKMRDCQVEQMKYKDERLKMMSEILNGIKVLKLYAWEKSMEQMVLEIRKKEIYVLKKLAFLNAATTLSWSCAPFLVAVLTFGVYVKLDPENNILTPQITFVALALFNILRFPLAIFAMIFSQFIQCSVSNKRLKAFFAEEEMEPPVTSGRSNHDECIRIENGSFSWDSDTAYLRQLDLSIPQGSLVAVVGRVGSGKSSLLSAILGEMNKTGGSVSVNGTIAYVPQQAWIQNQSLRENILFNRPMDRTHYEKVIDTCALRPDLSSLPAEDMTEIGEKGINLSGGQKQRVSLARAVYSHCDIVLLDDPLSAVDAHVGKHIFEKVISSATGVLKSTTRIFVTHGLHYLKYCDQIIVMKDGEISERGTYKELMSSQGAFGEFLEEYLVEEAKHRARSVSFGEDAEDVNEILSEIEKLSPDKRKRIESQISQVHSSTESLNRLPATPREKSPMMEIPSPKLNGTTGTTIAREEEAVPNEDEKKALLGEKIKKGKLMEKEAMETGKVKWSVYTSYITAIGYSIAMVFLSVYIVSSVLGVWSNLWLASWSDDAKRIQQSENGTAETNIRLLIYAGLGMGQALFVCVASVIMALGMVRASRILHEGILRNTLHSPMSFFDITPLGRILNRFGKDVDMLDGRLPGSLVTYLGAMIQLCMTLFVPSYVAPQVIPAILPTLLIYLFTMRFYVSTSRQLKRLDSASRSPIYSHFQESIQGASSIRAYNATERFMDESAKKVDENLQCYYPSIVANRWLAVRLELVGNMIVLFAALFAALFRDSPGISAGLVGLSVSYALNITQTLNWAVRMTSELETNIVAVERIKEYTETPTEGRPPSRKPKDVNWPSRGDIAIKNYSLRYREGLDLVLEDITAHVKPTEKIGIVGRTGAGKSSLTLALFRIIEADGGVIEIDGENIADLALESLRSRLTIVPQDPVLFSGTLRVNLDPFSAFDDDSIWIALQNAHLDSFVSDLPNKLSHSITEGGENLSVGQRQLLCLARALLRKTKILILDEAAAAVDMETDALIQRTIREQFKDCTVLTIAHRLNTVMDSDRLMVLDHGHIMEFDSPRNLLTNTSGVFYAMAKDAGVV